MFLLNAYHFWQLKNPKLIHPKLGTIPRCSRIVKIKYNFEFSWDTVTKQEKDTKV